MTLFGSSPRTRTATARRCSRAAAGQLAACLGLRTLGLTAGQILAVSGGAGQLASYVIPLAKELGASVIADARPEDEDLVRGFGADVVA